MYHFFSKNHMIWQENGFSSDFISWALSTVSLHGKISLNFWDKVTRFSFNKTHKTRPIEQYYIKKKQEILSQMEKYTKISTNQDLNDFLLETLAWINYHQR